MKIFSHHHLGRRHPLRVLFITKFFKRFFSLNFFIHVLAQKIRQYYCGKQFVVKKNLMGNKFLDETKIGEKNYEK